MSTVQPANDFDTIVRVYVALDPDAPEMPSQDGAQRVFDVEREVTKYLEELSLRTTSRATRDAYRADLGMLAQYLAGVGITDPRKIDRDALVGYLASQRARGLSEATVARRAASMRSWLSWAIERGIVSREVTAPKVSMPRVGVPKALTLEQVRKLLGSIGRRKLIDIRDSAILEFLWSTGCRVSEVCGLDLDDLRLHAGADGITRGEATVRGKGRKQRVVYLTPRAADATRHYIDKARKPIDIPIHARAVFVSSQGHRLEPRTLWMIVRRRAADAGLECDVSPHWIRHTYATEMLRGGASVEHVRAMLGHESVATTQRYLHLSGGDIQAAHGNFHPDAQENPVFR